MRHQITVLIIEDNPDDLFLLQEFLGGSEEIEANIVHAERLSDAISIARSTPVDVAIIDLSLPDSFGLETFSSFHAAFPLIPAIIMTGAKDQAMALVAVQQGAQDYLFKGEPSPTAVIRTIRYAIERQRLTTELKEALHKVKQLKGLLPICSSCKKIRDDQGYWNRLESYISRHSDVEFSHSLCPQCAKTLYPDLDIYDDDAT